MMADFDANAPVIIGVGEASRKTVPGEWPSPRELAGAAIKAALTDTRTGCSCRCCSRHHRRNPHLRG